MWEKNYGSYELMKFTIWFTIIGFWGGLTIATTLLGIDGLLFDVRKLIELEVVVGWSMIAMAGIGLVFDLLRHTWEPELDEGNTTRAMKHDVRRAA